MAHAISILHTNDFHGHLTGARVAELAAARESVDLYFDCGDAIKTGNLGIPLAPEEAWTRLAECRCDASVLGNRETHVLESAFRRKLEGATHPILVANLRMRSGALFLPGSQIFERHGVLVGVFGVMVPMVTERMVTARASQLLWDPPIESAARVVAELRPNVDLLIALTHMGISQDRKLAEAVSGIDVILGGHSHTVLETPERVGETWIAQGGSHGRYFGRYEWTPAALTGALVQFGAGSA